MTQFAKYIDENTVKYPPRKFVSPTKVIFNFDKASAEILAEEGYIPIVETNSREDVQDETHYARPTYTFDNEQILCTYVAEEITEEEE